jgi:tRNA pseudouridine55 synthase
MKIKDKNMAIYNGWLVMNKPTQMSSNHLVQKVKRFFGKENKVGHAGTLDPLAQGVLPIAVGEATKTVQYLMDSDKEYEFDVTWGEERDTGDAEGAVINAGGIIAKQQEIEGILSKFIGKIQQVPPIYSALKINGQAAYKLARSGRNVEMKPREVRIDSLELIRHNDGVSGFRVLCGKGTYVRSLAIDIARALDTYGYVSFLKRTKVGNFYIKDAVSLENLSERNLLPVNYAIADMLAIELAEDQVKLLRNGIKIFLEQYVDVSEQLVQVLLNNTLQAIVLIEKGLAKPVRVFNHISL